MQETNYPLGRLYDRLPIPIDLERCQEVAAGPLTFLIEGRRLTTAAVSAHRGGTGHEEFDDQGVSLHVLAAGDGREYLRFDCFEREPHYHYLGHDPALNRVIRYDEVAGGDCAQWAIERIRTRLPEMLEFAGRGDLAGAVRAEPDTVRAAVDKAAAILAAALAGDEP